MRQTPDPHDISEIILIHNGGLGDFLTAWPTIFALGEHFSGLRKYWAGKPGYLTWTEALGFERCPGRTERELSALGHAPGWPEGLNRSLVVRFGLKSIPFAMDDERFVYLRGIEGDSFRCVRNVYAEALAGLGIGIRRDAIQVFRRLFGQGYTSAGKRKVLIFPGSGHAKKCLPMDIFGEVADYLRGINYHPLYVYGPVEVERDFVRDKASVTITENHELSRALLDSALAIGNDSGVMHLAGMLGIPGIAVFGPTSEIQWGPVDIRTLFLDLECRPCTQIAKITCESAHCMKKIESEMIINAIDDILYSKVLN